MWPRKSGVPQTPLSGGDLFVASRSPNITGNPAGDSVVVSSNRKRNSCWLNVCSIEHTGWLHDARQDATKTDRMCWTCRKTFGVAAVQLGIAKVRVFGGMANFGTPLNTIFCVRQESCDQQVSVTHPGSTTQHTQVNDAPRSCRPRHHKQMTPSHRLDWSGVRPLHRHAKRCGCECRCLLYLLVNNFSLDDCVNSGSRCSMSARVVWHARAHLH